MHANQGVAKRWTARVAVKPKAESRARQLKAEIASMSLSIARSPPSADDQQYWVDFNNRMRAQLRWRSEF